jgi:hypothetical protein
MSFLAKKEIILSIIISVVLGAGIGFGVSHSTFNPQFQSLRTEAQSLETSLESLQTQFQSLQEAYISASLRDDRLGSFTSHSVQGAVINFGNETASNIVITVKWYKEGASFHQEVITIPSLEGRAIKEINFTYTFVGTADDFDYTLTWD